MNETLAQIPQEKGCLYITQIDGEKERVSLYIGGSLEYDLIFKIKNE